MTEPFRHCFAEGGAVGSLPQDSDYGGGLLETMRCESGHLPLWPLHRARLRRSGRLAAHLPAIERSLAAAAQRSAAAGAVKLRLRCGQLRGRPRWDISARPLPRDWSLDAGIELFPCRRRLLLRRVNWGCKELLRTEYERAARELPVTHSAIDGLMLDMRGHVIETLRCNLLFWYRGDWYTPKLSRCGVRGVMRDWLLQRVAVRQVDVTLADLRQAAEVALCNSLRGVVPVRNIMGVWRRSPGRHTRRLQRLIAEELW